MEKCFVLGRTDLTNLLLINQDEPFTMSSYFTIKDAVNGDLVVEIMETLAFPILEDSVLPMGATCRMAEALGFDSNKTTYLAKAKLLKRLTSPVTPSSPVYRSKFDEVDEYVLTANEADCLTLGVIKGTEFIQKELPANLANIAPLWANGSAIPQNGIPFLFDYRKSREYPHIGCFGSSGSGKSFSVRTIMEELIEKNIPMLCLDPHYEMRFTGVMDGLDNSFKKDFASRCQEFTVGKDIGIRFKELSFAELVTLFQYVDDLTEPQKGCLEALYVEGMSQEDLKYKITVVKEAFEIMDQNRIRPQKQKLTQEQDDLYNDYKNKVSGSAALQALLWKYTSLLNTGIFEHNVQSAIMAMKQHKSVIVHGSIDKLKMISSYLITKFYNQRRKTIDNNQATNNQDYFPPFFIVVDEAHNFAPAEGKNLPIRTILRKIGQEARKYGVFLILCTQRPRNLDGTLLAQLNTKIFLRLTDCGDMEIARNEGNLTDMQVAMLPDLTSGSCFISSAVLPKTFYVQFRTTFSKAPNVADPFDELKTINAFNSTEEAIIKAILNNPKCKDSRGMSEMLVLVRKETGKNIEVMQLTKIIEDMGKSGKLKLIKNSCGVIYEVI